MMARMAEQRQISFQIITFLSYSCFLGHISYYLLSTSGNLVTSSISAAVLLFLSGWKMKMIVFMFLVLELSVCPSICPPVCLCMHACILGLESWVLRISCCVILLCIRWTEWLLIFSYKILQRWLVEQWLVFCAPSWWSCLLCIECARRMKAHMLWMNRNDLQLSIHTQKIQIVNSLPEEGRKNEATLEIE